MSSPGAKHLLPEGQHHPQVGQVITQSQTPTVSTHSPLTPQYSQQKVIAGK